MPDERAADSRATIRPRRACPRARGVNYRHSDSHNNTVRVGLLRTSVSYRVTYCIECGWSVSTESCTRSEQSDLAIDHYVETGHEIDSERRGIEGSVTGRSEERPPTE